MLIECFFRSGINLHRKYRVAIILAFSGYMLFFIVVGRVIHKSNDLFLITAAISSNFDREKFYNLFKILSYVFTL